MNHCLHASDRRAADFWTAAFVLMFFGSAFERALAGAWSTALVFGAIAGAAVVWRLVRGPWVGPAVIELTDDELIFRQPFYIPTKTQRFRLDHIRGMKVVGPRLGRFFRFELEDGVEEEVRPYFGPVLGPGAVAFLKENLPSHVRIHEKRPASLMAQVRGDY